MRPLLLWLVLGTLLVACAPVARPTPAEAPRVPVAVQRFGSETGLAGGVQELKGAPVVVAPAATPVAVSVNPPEVIPNPAVRLIIKNAEMRLVVSSVDEALTRIEGLVAEVGGYILSSRTWFQDEEKYASLTFAVPSERFEETLGRLRRIGVRVADENTSGQDVSQEYVDLEARLANLEAAVARLREFLKEAKSVEEALQVEARLRELEGEIAQVKGRMNFLKGRSAYSLITIILEPLRPTPTPTPIVWDPGETFREATGVLGTLLRTLVDLSIWVLVLSGPFMLPAGAITLVVYRLRHRHRPRSSQ